jgi:hypothetical protein
MLSKLHSPLTTAAELAESRRLSRFLFVAQKPAERRARVG